MSEWNYIIAAYALTWIGLLGYAVQLGRRLNRAARDLAREIHDSDSEVR